MFARGIADRRVAISAAVISISGPITRPLSASRAAATAGL